MKLLLCGALALASSMVFAAAYDIGKDFVDKEKWASDPVEFNIDHKQSLFRFTDQKRECAVAMKPSDQLLAAHPDFQYVGVVFHELPVSEARVYFGDGAVKRIEISLYNKGDNEPLPQDEFNQLLEKARTAVTPAGTKAPEPVKEKLPGGMYRKVQRWDKTFPAVELTWGWSEALRDKRRVAVPEFLRVTLVGAADASAARKELTSSTQQKSKDLKKIKENVQKYPNGDVFIAGVPMVDQGQKGYCAAATSERVLRYYGIEMDEHEIAQLAGTSAQSGTETGAMVAAVTQVGNKVGLRKEDIIAAQGGGDTTWEKSDFYKTLQLYNQAAKNLKEPTIDWNEYKMGNTIQVGEMFKAMKPKVIKAARAKLSGQMKRFHDEIRKQVNAGVPMFWGVMLGYYPEPEIPQSSGGHMRLVIGYNDKTKEILYTDTWGAGHELKRMPEDWAWTMTNCLLFLKPKQ